MKLQMNLPFSQWDFKLSGVYKITFPDGTYYVGCSKNLRSRAFAWSGIMETGKGEAGKDIGTMAIDKIREFIDGVAVMDIIEMCAVIDLKDKEAFYMDKWKDDKKMLSEEKSTWRAVLQYNKDGGFIKKHYSIGAAARYNQTTMSSIQRVLNGERKTSKDMVFIYENDYHDRRKSIIKSRYQREKKGNRDLVMMDENGVELKRFKKVAHAAIELGCKSINIVRAVSGFQNTAKGYYFKYATAECKLQDAAIAKVLPQSNPFINNGIDY